MERYCASCKKCTTNENSSVRKTKQSRSMLLLNCAKSYFFIKFLFIGETFMPELHLKQSEFTYIA